MAVKLTEKFLFTCNPEVKEKLEFLRKALKLRSKGAVVRKGIETLYEQYKSESNDNE